MSSNSYACRCGQFTILVVAALLGGCSPTPQNTPQRLAQNTPSTNPSTAQQPVTLTLQQQREALDATVWAPEVEAQRHEETFVRLWDRLRGPEENRFAVAQEFGFSSLHYLEPGDAAAREAGIRVHSLSGKSMSLTHPQWKSLLDRLKSAGFRIAQTEWHHAEFRPSGQTGPESVVTLAIDIEREVPPQRYSLRGKLDIAWEKSNSRTAYPQPRVMTLRDAVLVQRDGTVPFQPLLEAQTDNEHRRLMPLMLYDLNGDGLSEIVLGGLNRIYWNRGQNKFDATPLYAPGIEMFDSAVLADFNDDRYVDLVYVGIDRYPMLLAGGPGGEFRTAPQRCGDVQFELPKSFTAGDIDGDDDLDLFIGQYKFPYIQGAMPTPFYDANDGYPAALLRNDGDGNFADITVAAGLQAKQRRRTFSSSLVDLDQDGDLDLLTVNDFSGVDLYENNGQGLFEEVTGNWANERHLFGMGHTLADFDRDGRLDMYLIGMSSTTARRLDALQLGRDDHPDINRMRQAMGYGNRLLLGQPPGTSPLYRQSPKNDQICRTGWSWGTSSLDVENDGDPDIYVGNGHTSGKSAKDYCTRYWCHDVYTGTSDQSRELNELFGASLRDLHQRDISWNGFEHNFLWLNHGDGDFTNVAFPFGVAFEFDSRGVVSDDLDGDGRKDLLVVQYLSRHVSHTDYKLHVLRNAIDPAGHWIGVRLEKSVTGRSPVGAVVTMSAAGKTYVQQIVNGDSFSSQHAPVVHFGIGTATAVDSLQIAWPDGHVQRIESPSIDRYLDLAGENQP